MKRALSLLVLFLWPAAVQAQTAFDPTLASVRIKSHGASGTCIATTRGRTWILSCCHMFFDRGTHVSPEALRKPLRMDGPQQPQAVSPGVAQARLLAYDAGLDLSLIELDNGPFYYVPVAREGHQATRGQDATEKVGGGARAGRGRGSAAGVRGEDGAVGTHGRILIVSSFHVVSRRFMKFTEMTWIPRRSSEFHAIHARPGG
jgi:hypothetical protein